MRSLLFLSLLFTTFCLSGQAPVTQIEGYLELYQPEDESSIYIGKYVAKGVVGVGQRNNTMVGARAGKDNSTGSGNSFFGVAAGFSNTDGLNNSFFGSSAGNKNETGDFNTFFGNGSGNLNTTGNRNAFFGTYAGSTNSTGSGNVCIGDHAGPFYNASNRLFIDNHQTNDPLIYGDFDLDILTINGKLRLGSTDHFMGGDDGLIVSPNMIGADIFLVANDAVIVEIGAFASENGTFEIWEATTNNIILELDEAGNLTIAGTLEQGSDRRNKELIKPLNNADILEKIIDLPISEWQYIGQDIRHIGPMAQDFYHTFGLGKGETTISSIDADGVAIAAIKALAQENQDLKVENARITERLERLEALLIK